MNPTNTNEFSTRNFQLAIFLHAAGVLPYLRTEPSDDGSGKVNFVFQDDKGQAQQLQLEYNRGAAVAARSLFGSQTFLRQQITGITENKKTGESSHELTRHR